MALRSAPREATPRSNATDSCARAVHVHQHCPHARHTCEERARTVHFSPQPNMCAHRPVPNTPRAHMLLPRAHRQDERARLEAPDTPH
eukprot:343621-Prymnesium_polylepis.1